MAANNFKELERQNEEQFRKGESANKIHKNVSHSMRFFQFFGNIFELYLPRVLGVFVNMSGGAPNMENSAERSSDTDRPKYPNNTNKK